MFIREHGSGHVGFRAVWALALPTLLCLTANAQAVIYQAPLPRDYPTKVMASTSFDPGTRLYTYAYTIANPPSNPSGVCSFTLWLQRGANAIIDVRSPRGWSDDYLARRHLLNWSATEVTVPDGGEDDGNILPSDFDIAPGRTLSGFSFTSADPPGIGLAITQTFARLPAADDSDELSGLPYESTLPEENGFRLRVPMPVPQPSD